MRQGGAKVAIASLSKIREARIFGERVPIWDQRGIPPCVLAKSAHVVCFERVGRGADFDSVQVIDFVGLAGGPESGRERFAADIRNGSTIVVFSQE